MTILKQSKPLIVSSLLMLGATGVAQAQIVPKFSGQVWFDGFYQDRFDEQTSGFRVNRGVIGAQADLTPAWALQFSYIANKSEAVLQDAYLQYRPQDSALRVQFGRTKLPYYDYIEQSFVERWTNLHSQAEVGSGTNSSGFLSYRNEGVKLNYAASDAVNFAAMVRNGSSDAGDADFGWNGAFAWKLADGVQVQASIDQVAASPATTPAEVALTTVNASLGVKNTTLAGLVEFNYRKSKPVNADGEGRTGFGFSGLYSLDGTVGQSEDVGLLASLHTGDDEQKTLGQTSLKLSAGAYKRISANLRSAINVVSYSKVETVANSGGTAVVWSWEATF